MRVKKLSDAKASTGYDVVTGETKITRGVALDPVLTSVNALMNNGVRTARGSSTEIFSSFPPELVNALRAGFPAGKVYSFEMHFNSTLATDSGGTLQRVISWDPSISSFLEWSALSTLFDECLFGGSCLELVSAFGPSSTAIVSMVAVAPDPMNMATTFPTVQRLSASRIMHVYNAARTWRATNSSYRGRPWAPINDPGGAAGTPAGMLGRWAVANYITATPSTNYLFAALRVRARFRTRA